MSDRGRNPVRPGTYGISRELVYENPYQYVFRVDAVLGGRRREFFVTDYGERSAVVLTDGDRVMLVRQRRLFLDHLSWEIPGGRINDGETPEAAAIRECLEETGMACEIVAPLLRFHPGLDTLWNPSFLFHARPAGDPARSHSRDDVEQVEHRSWVPLARCLEMIQHGEIVDSISILGLLSFQARAAQAAV